MSSTDANKARPILFSSPMVLALLAARKSQTRRIVKDAPVERDGYLCTQRITFRDAEHYAKVAPEICPYGKVGDYLWVRETWCAPVAVDPSPVFYRADYPACVPKHFENVPQDPADVRWKPSIFMPRSASRLTLRLTDVRVELLQDISESDVLAEGVTMPESEREERDESLCAQCGGTLLVNRVHPVSFGMMFDCDCMDCSTARDRYRHLWNFINGDDAWSKNPWCWALAFETINKNVDQVMATAGMAA